MKNQFFNIYLIIYKIINKLILSFKKEKSILGKDDLNPISVCVPCYEMHGKGYEYLKRLLESLCIQSFKVFEVIISDQSKRTFDIKKCAEEYSNKLNIVYIKHDGSSSSSNMNNAIENASYQLIKPMFQDDFLISTHAMYEIAKCKSGWGASGFIHTDSKETHYYKRMMPRWNDKLFIGINTVGCPSVMHFYKNDKTFFDDKLIWLMDCDFYQLLYTIYGLPQILLKTSICVRIWDDSVSGIISESIKDDEYEYIRKKWGFKPVLHGHSISNNFSRYEKEVSISVDSIFHDDKIDFKLYLQIEPPEVLSLTEDIIKYHDYYDIILTWNEEILKNCRNAILFPFGTSWVKDHNTEINKKKFKISFITSDKNYTVGHKFRQEVFNTIPKKVGSIEIVKHKSPPFLRDKTELLKTFQYSIVIENGFLNNWFTEKLIDCFITKTIPIYRGCPNVSEFFNIDGIFTFSNYNELENIIMFLTPEKYYDLSDIIEENYNKALEYVNIWTRVDKIIEEKMN